MWDVLIPPQSGSCPHTLLIKLKFPQISQAEALGLRAGSISTSIQRIDASEASHRASGPVLEPRAARGKGRLRTLVLTEQMYL